MATIVLLGIFVATVLLGRNNDIIYRLAHVADLVACVPVFSSTCVK